MGDDQRAEEPERSYAESMADYFASLAVKPADQALPILGDLLRNRDEGTYEKHIVPRLACRALLHHGAPGVKVIAEALPEAPGAIYPNAILEALWFAAKGELGLDIFGVAAKNPVLNGMPSEEAVLAAKAALRDVLAESRANDELFWRLVDFVSSPALRHRDLDGPFLHDVRGFFAEATIRLTPSLLVEFSELLDANMPEEIYHQFLASHPVLLDPLADEVVSKQKLGVDHITDFALRRLDDRWLLVEIEKPQDAIFTAANDFTASFTHAYGQVLDFQRWVEENGAYAQRLMPGIASPAGLLVIGRRVEFQDLNSAKLRRFVANSRTIDVLTFDDVLANARALYRNIYYRPLA